MEQKQRILAFTAMRRRMEELFENVDEAQRALDILADRDEIDLSPESVAKRVEGILLKEDTGAALKRLNLARKEAVEFNATYIKERDALAALGILKPRPGKTN